MRFGSLHSILASCAFAAIPFYSAAAVSIEGAQLDLKIDSEPLGQALQEFANQSGIQVIFFSKVTEGLHAPALRGRFTADAALHLLLNGSKLTYREINPNTIEIRPLAAVDSLLKNDDSQLSPPQTNSNPAAVPAPMGGRVRLAAADQGVGSGGSAVSHDADAAGSVEEITVTARRVSENLQAAPVSVTAFSSGMLQQLAIEDATDFSGRAPNVQIMQTGAGAGAVSIFIRGIGNTALGFNLENPVGMYVDDVYLPRLQGSLIDLLDLDRVEILRGPQGTLYGRDSTVGALKYISKAPDLYDAHYTGEVVFGDFDRRDARVGVSIPVIQGTLAVKVDAATRSQDGYMVGVDPAGVPTGQLGNGIDRSSGRISALYTPNAQWRITLEADIANDRSGSTQATPLVAVGGGACHSAVAPCRTLFNSPYDTGINSVNPGFDDTSGESAHVEYDAGWGLIKSITAYRTLKELDQIDLSQVPDTDRLLPDHKDQDQVSEELQLQSKNSGPFTWLAGLFYFREHITHYANFINIQLNDDDQNSNSYAAFADVTYAIIDDLRLDLGGRISTDEKTIDRAVLPVGGGPAIINGNNTFTETKGTYKAGLDYTITPDVMAYVSNSTGYRPGSFSSTYASPAVAPVVFGHTNAETAINTELGIKTEWLDHRLRANFDIFHTKYENEQTQATSFPYNVTATNFNFKGFEAEIDAKPFNELTIFANLGLLRASTLSGPQAGMHPHFAPSVEGSVGAEYKTPVAANVSLFAGVNDVYTSSFSTDPSDIPSVMQGAYSLLGAQLGLEFYDGKYRVYVDGKNLTDKAYFIATSPDAVQFYGPPRTVFVTLAARL
jgi:iron complex outermembrane receptor protein